MQLLQADTLGRIVDDGLTREWLSRTGLTSWAGDVSMGCEAPAIIELSSAVEDGFHIDRQTKERRPDLLSYADVRFTVDLAVPCRKCKACLRRDRRRWETRIQRECSRANRTWMATYTISPAARMMVEGTRKDVPIDSDDYFALLWVERVRVLSRELQLHLKRVRKSVDKPIRFFAVFEPHRDGWPHIHMLIHADHELLKKQCGTWNLGFQKVKLVQEGAGALYVAKYCAKEGSSVRASVRYGEEPEMTGTLLPEEEDLSPKAHATSEAVKDGHSKIGILEAVTEPGENSYDSNYKPGSTSWFRGQT